MGAGACLTSSGAGLDGALLQQLRPSLYGSNRLVDAMKTRCETYDTAGGSITGAQPLGWPDGALGRATGGAHARWPLAPAPSPSLTFYALYAHPNAARCRIRRIRRPPRRAAPDQSAASAARRPACTPKWAARTRRCRRPSLSPGFSSYSKPQPRAQLHCGAAQALAAAASRRSLSRARRCKAMRCQQRVCPGLERSLVQFGG